MAVATNRFVFDSGVDSEISDPVRRYATRDNADPRAAVLAALTFPSAQDKQGKKGVLPPAAKPVLAPTRGEPVVRKRLPKAAPVVQDKVALAAKAAELRAEILAGAGRSAPSATPTASSATMRTTKQPRTVADVKKPVVPQAAHVIAAPISPKFRELSVASASSLDNCIRDLSHYNKLIGAVDDVTVAVENPSADEHASFVDNTIVEQQHGSAAGTEQLFYGPSGELVTLSGYAALYGMAVEELIALYPEMAPSSSSVPVAGAAVPEPALDPVPATGAEDEADDISDLLALCLK